MSPRVADPAVRTTLIEKAGRILAEEGPSALTVRRLAAAAGSSTMAVYTHFEGMPEIRRAIRVEGFARLGHRLAAVPVSTDPVADLVATGAVYLAYGLAEPHLYRAMFLDRPAEPDDTGVETFQRLGDLIRRCQDAGRFPAGDPALTTVWAAQVWSMRHGIVVMVLTGLLPPDMARFVLDDMTLRLLVGYGDDPGRAQRSLATGNQTGGHDVSA
jgi:AcrR family transcriptional regulator